MITKERVNGIANDYPLLIRLPAFIFGAFLSSSAALIANIYKKISMHAIGCGGMLGFMFWIWAVDVSYAVTIPLCIVLLLAGIVCTSRMIISDHSEKEIYYGLLL